MAEDLPPSGARRVVRRLPLVIVALIGAVAAIVAYRLAVNADDARVRGVVELRAEWRARDLERKLTELAEPLQTLRTVVALDEPIDQSRFDRIAVLSRLAGNPLRRLTWAPRATGTTGRSSYPVAMEHAFGKTASLIGADLAAEPLRRAVIDRARDEGRPLSTPPLPLLVNPTNPGLIIFWPVFAHGVVPATVAERRALIRGFVTGSWTLDDALNAAIRGTPRIVETIHFFAGNDGAAAMPAAVYSPAEESVTPDGAMAAGPPAGDVRIKRGFEVFGQKWALVSDFGPSVLDPLRSAADWAFPAGTVALTLILLAYLWREQQHRADAERRVAVRTAALRHSNTALESEIGARRKTYEQLVQAQKMEAVGSLTGGLAHDFNNLLGIIIGNLDLLREREADDPELRELTGEALDAATRGADLTRRLLAFARRQTLQPVRTDVNELVSRLVTLLKRTLGENIEVTLELGTDLWPVLVDPVQLEASLTNLATNARDAMPKGGHLIVATANRHLDDDYASQHAEVAAGDYALIEVSDTGTGMPPDIANRIFEPFFTTKEQGKGSGLGLAMVFGFIKQSGGHINVYSELGIGTTFRLYLPRAKIAAETRSAAPAQPVVRGGGESVLVVEDNAGLRRVVVRQLAELGYRAFEADDAQAALRLLESRPIDLLLTDLVMPGGASGYDLARRVRRRWPKIKIVLTSGFPEAKVGGNGKPAAMPLLSKPYRRDDLARTIHQTLTEAPVRSSS